MGDTKNHRDPIVRRKATEPARAIDKPATPARADGRSRPTPADRTVEVLVPETDRVLQGLIRSLVQKPETRTARA